MSCESLDCGKRCSNVCLRVLLDHFTPEQYARFEAYSRSALNKNSVRKVMPLPQLISVTHVNFELNTQVVQNLTGQQVSPNVAQVVAGIAKIFVGEIIEKGSSSIIKVPIRTD